MRAEARAGLAVGHKSLQTGFAARCFWSLMVRSHKGERATATVVGLTYFRHLMMWWGFFVHRFVKCSPPNFLLKWLVYLKRPQGADTILNDLNVHSLVKALEVVMKILFRFMLPWTHESWGNLGFHRIQYLIADSPEF